MRERALLLGAQLVVGSPSGRGTEIILSIPDDPEVA
jgi:signal transduction histidine kinase